MTAESERREVDGQLQPVDLSALLGAEGGPGVLWSLGRGTGLNLNLVRLDAGEGISAHVNHEVDVVYVGLAGSARLELNGAETLLVAGSLVHVAQGVERSIVAGATGVGYLTIHPERQGPSIRSRPPTP